MFVLDSIFSTKRKMLIYRCLFSNVSQWEKYVWAPLTTRLNVSSDIVWPPQIFASKALRGGLDQPRLSVAWTTKNSVCTQLKHFNRNLMFIQSITEIVLGQVNCLSEHKNCFGNTLMLDWLSGLFFMSKSFLLKHNMNDLLWKQENEPQHAGTYGN